MILVGLVALAIWFGARAFGVSTRARWLMLWLLYVIVLIEQVALPEGSALREVTGQSPALWLLLGGFALDRAVAVDLQNIAQQPTVFFVILDNQ